MTYKRRVILMRFLRSLGAVLASAVAAWVAGPDAAELVGEDAQAMIVALGTPLLVSLDKWLRYGADDDDFIEEV